MLGIPTPHLFYSYSLPCDFLDDPAVAGVTMSDYKSRLSGAVGQMIRMLEHPGEEIRHRKDPARFLNTEELRAYRLAQLQDPYYEPFLLKLKYEGKEI